METNNKCIIDEAVGVVGASPEGMGDYIFIKCENDTYYKN